MLQPEESKPFIHVGSGEGTSDDTVTASSVWSLLPDSNKLDTMPALPAIDRSTISDVAAVYGQTPYYNPGYSATGYGVYDLGATNPATYYQQMALGGGATSRFPYSLTTPAAATAYYGSTYGAAAAANFTDYTSAAYNSQYYNSMRNGYYNLAAGSAGYQSASSAGDSTDLSAFNLKGGDVKKCKSSKKKKGSCSPNENQFARVFIWDLNDICVYTPWALTSAAGKAPHSTHYLLSLKTLAQHVLSLAFPVDQLDECEVINVEDAALDEQVNTVDPSLSDGRGGVEMARRLATKYLALKQLYLEYGCKSDALIDRCGISTKKEEISEALRQMDLITGNRRESAKRCLELVAERSSMSSEKYANIVICNDGLAPGISQVLVSGLAPTVPIENVYSCMKQGKDSVLDRVMNRFGKKCSYVVVTGNQEMSVLAKKESMAVWPVLGCDDLEKLYTAQSNYLLGSMR